MFNEYNHAEFVNCRDVADFAKVYCFRDSKNEIIGRNKIFKILRALGILNKENVPYQTFIKYFKTLEKEYENGVSIYKKTIVFITSEGQTYLANKINNYLENNDIASVKKKTKKNKPPVEIIDNKPVETGSPLDFTREKALEFYSNMPEMLRESSYFAKQLKVKWGF